MEGRKQVNLPDDIIDALDDLAEQLAAPGASSLKYPDVIRYLLAQYDPKKYGRKK